MKIQKLAILALAIFGLSAPYASAHNICKDPACGVIKCPDNCIQVSQGGVCHYQGCFSSHDHVSVNDQSVVNVAATDEVKTPVEE